ncbi:MAG: hypothetical protein J5727_02540 [Kiritimatiellae bacterium]|nr:hypothetical protein [Kiritimatiellia bacterium]
MDKFAKSFAALAVAAVALAGCSSYTEIAKWNSNIPVNDGEVPVASFVTQNFSYELLWCIPLCTGRPWTEGPGDEGIEDRYNVKLFANEATIDGNLASLNHALDLVGSHRISQLKTVEDDSKAWSLFLINRHEVRTQCLILPEKQEE